MEVKFITRELTYTGAELRPHWIFEEFGIRGDASVAWIGPCRVGIEELVDLEDADSGSTIAADEMLHFIVEHFLFRDLLLTIHRQHLLVACAQNAITDLSGAPPIRNGNDLFIGQGKLSVSVATASPVSGLIHFGINVTNAGTPVITSSLQIGRAACRERV